jgi:hypothetical protein
MKRGRKENKSRVEGVELKGSKRRDVAACLAKSLLTRRRRAACLAVPLLLSCLAVSLLAKPCRCFSVGLALFQGLFQRWCKASCRKAGEAVSLAACSALSLPGLRL